MSTRVRRAGETSWRVTRVFLKLFIAKEGVRREAGETREGARGGRTVWRLSQSTAVDWIDG